MKLAVDTNFLISATQWDYSVSHKLLQKLIIENNKIFATKEIIEEFENVLRRDFSYNNEEIENIISTVLQFLILVEPSKGVDIVEEDADDNKIIECALESDSECILSYDKHLLDLKEYQNIKILTPEEFLKTKI